MPVLSVLLPCYNAAATLEECLQSLAAQTFGDFEIVAVDDGSSDDTLAILQAWSRREPRLRWIAQPHGGIVSALRCGLAACQAPLVARMDADDRCHPERFRLQVAYLQEHADVGLVSCRVAAFPATEVREGFLLYLEWLNALLTDADIRREIFIESPLPHPSVLFRRQVVLAVGGYQEHGWPEDYDLWLRLALAGVRFAKLPEVLLEWRERPDRLTRQDARYSVENFLRLKACYLVSGPLAGCDAVIIWGAGMMGRRLSKHLLRREAPLVGFVDIDPRKIGRTRRALPVWSADSLLDLLKPYRRPVVLVAVGARGARPLIRQRLRDFGLEEAHHWWFVA